MVRSSSRSPSADTYIYSLEFPRKPYFMDKWHRTTGCIINILRRSSTLFLFSPLSEHALPFTSATRKRLCSPFLPSPAIHKVAVATRHHLHHNPLPFLSICLPWLPLLSPFPRLPLLSQYLTRTHTQTPASPVNPRHADLATQHVASKMQKASMFTTYAQTPSILILLSFLKPSSTQFE